MTDDTKPRRATLADLQVQTYEFEIVAPTGETLVVEMRAPSQADVLELDRAMPEPPTPPEKDFRKDENGVLQVVYDEQDPGYRRAVEERRVLFMNKLILRCWQTDIPGDTEDERIAEINNLAAWAKSGLFHAANLLTVMAAERVRFYRFQRGGTVALQPAQSDAVDGSDVVELIEG